MRLSRRRFVEAGLTTIAALPVTVRAQTGQGDAQALPNILWVVSEDNNPLIGAYGDKLAHTPNLDKLAEKGIVYRNVYSNAPVCNPSRYAIITGMYPESNAPAHHMAAVAHVPKYIEGIPSYLRRAGYYCTNSAKTGYNCDLKTSEIWDESSNSAHWRKRPEGKPFFSVFNYHETHESSIFTELDGRVKPADVRVAAYLPDTPAVRQDYATFYNRMEAMDGQIGDRIAELVADGLYEDTIIFYYSDNGGIMPRGKRFCYDEGLRCSMIVHFPPKWQHLSPMPMGSDVHAPVTFVDLAPTVLSLAGVPVPDHMHGRPFLGRQTAAPQKLAFGMRNRMDERYDMTRTVTDSRYRYIRNYSPHRIWGQHGAYEWRAKSYQDWEAGHLAGTLTPAQERFWTQKPFEEFYDLSVDKDQVNNLIGDTSQARRIADMREALDRHMIEVNDNGFIPEGAAEEGIEHSASPQAYPLRRLMALATKAAQRDPRNLSHFRDNAKDPNHLIRYWSTEGILMLGEHAAEVRPLLEQLIVNDPSVHVRISAAEALTGLGGGIAAVKVLNDIALTHPAMAVQLQALNSLTYVGEAAKGAMPAIRQAAESKSEYIRDAGLYLLLVLEGRYTPESKIFDPVLFPVSARDGSKST